MIWVNNNKLGRTWKKANDTTFREIRNNTKCSSKNYPARQRFRDMNVHDRMILKHIIQKRVVRMQADWTEQLKIGSNGEIFSSLTTWNCFFVSFCSRKSSPLVKMQDESRKTWRNGSRHLLARKTAWDVIRGDSTNFLKREARTLCIPNEAVSKINYSKTKQEKSLCNVSSIPQCLV